MTVIRFGRNFSLKCGAVIVFLYPAEAIERVFLFSHSIKIIIYIRRTMKRYFTTDSLALASAIQTISPSKLEFISRLPKSNKAEFNFDPKKDSNIEDLVERFWRYQLSGDLLRYFEAMKYIKSRLYHNQ